MTITTADLAAKLIAPFEGCRLDAYRDTGGIWTVGYGHTGPDVVPSLPTITQAQADALLIRDLAPLLAKVADRPILEAAALVSFGYNCGMGTLERVLAGHAMPGDFVHDHAGHVLPGLVARRALEEMLIDLSQQMQGKVGK